MWHATSAWEAHVARLGSQMNHLTKFRDPDARFESLGTYLELRDKFGDLACNLLFSKFHLYVWFPILILDDDLVQLLEF